MVEKYTYEQLLDKAYSELPEISEETVRFEIPIVKGSIQGNKTIISNLSQIAAVLRRPEAHLYKFLLRELATTGDQRKGQTVFIGRFRSDFLNGKIVKYVNEFIYCKQCKNHKRSKSFEIWSNCWQEGRRNKWIGDHP